MRVLGDSFNFSGLIDVQGAVFVAQWIHDCVNAFHAVQQDDGAFKSILLDL